ncbi:MAG: DMT family transporter, partial [Pseudomonadota bacterium]
MTQSTARAGTSARMDALTWAMLVLLSIVWGGSFFFVGVAVKEITPLTLVLARVGIAAIGLLAYVALIGVRTPLTRDVLIAFVGMAILNNVIPFTAIVSGQTQIASGLASILNSTTPIFTVVFANLLTDDEKLTSAKLAGVLLGVAGVAALMGPAAFAGLTDTIGGLALILVAACSYGFASIWGRRFRRLGVPAAVAATGQLCASTLLLIPLVLLIDQPWTLPMPSAATVWSIIGLALASTAFAYILFFRILQ